MPSLGAGKMAIAIAHGSVSYSGAVGPVPCGGTSQVRSPASVQYLLSVATVNLLFVSIFSFILYNNLLHNPLEHEGR